MSFEDSVSVISNLISKFIGKNNWIFLVAITLACMAGLYAYSYTTYKEVWWVVSIGSLCISILILNIITFLVTKLYTCVYQFFHQKNESKKRKKEQLEKQELAKINNEKINTKLASEIWALVEYATTDRIEDALIFLQLPLSDENPLKRYLAPAKDYWCEEYENYQKMYRASNYFSYNNNKMKLLTIESQSGGYFIIINNYFYNLLHHYAETGNWEKLSYADNSVS